MSDDGFSSVDLEELASRQISRREMLALAGAGGAAVALGLTAGRARGAVPSALLEQLAGTVTFGSNGSDPVPKAAYAAVMANFTKKTGTKVKINTVDHNTFQ